MLPEEVMLEIQSEFMNYKGTGCSIIEMSHRSDEFLELLDDTVVRFSRLANLPEDMKVLFLHGGARTQFAAVPINLIQLKPSKKAGYIVSGIFSASSAREAEKYGNIEIISSSVDQNYRTLPPFDATKNYDEYSYIHYTGNNTLFGSQWKTPPKKDGVNFVCDATSDILTRKFNYNDVAVLYASLQKNLGPSGLSLVAVKENVLGSALDYTPTMLNYQIAAENKSLANTINTFAVYVANLILKWTEENGGVDEMEKRNIAKSNLLYDYLDGSEFYVTKTDKNVRSIINVTFDLKNQDLESSFLSEAKKVGLVSLKGHEKVGGIRASMYNSMPLSGAQKLLDFMHSFEQKHK